MPKHNPFIEPKTAESYESWYHTAGKDAVNQEKKLIRTLFSRYDNAQTILEVGCGTGYFMKWFNSLRYQSVGIDQSKRMIDEAQKKLLKTCILGDAMTLPFSPRAFDLVVMITTLEFLADPLQALKEALRVARQGLILGVINRHSLTGCRYRLKRSPIWDIARFFTPRELMTILAENLSSQDAIIMKTTLWPIFSGISDLPWGGFIGLAVVFSETER